MYYARCFLCRSPCSRLSFNGSQIKLFLGDDYGGGNGDIENSLFEAQLAVIERIFAKKI
jgi:hypothetical protein